MSRVVILLLAAFWVVLALLSFSRGNPQRAVFYLLIGAALTIWRLSRLKRN